MRTPARKLSIAAALVGLGLAASSATALEPVGEQFHVSNPTPKEPLVTDAWRPASAFNSATGEHLVVWAEQTGPVDNTEIFARQIGSSGETLGLPWQVSFSGGGSAFAPDVTYNAVDDEFLVVWTGQEFSRVAPLLTVGREIFTQRITSGGDPIGGNQRVSDMGPLGSTDFRADTPAVTHDAVDNEYLVVWSGDDDSGALVDDEMEIFGQRLSGATGAEIGGDLRISFMGPDGDAGYDAVDPDVVHNPQTNEYVVVWSGNASAALGPEYEIHLQRFGAPTSPKLGTPVRVSDMGHDLNPFFGAHTPAITYNATDNEYLVAWSGDDDDAGLVDNEFEIHVQRLTAQAQELGTDTRISETGSDGSTVGDALHPAVSYAALDNQYVIAWETAGDPNAEAEIFGQQLTATGDQIGGDTRISFMGPEGDSVFKGSHAAISYDTNSGEHLVSWHGHHHLPAVRVTDTQIFARRVSLESGAPRALRLSR